MKKNFIYSSLLAALLLSTGCGNDDGDGDSLSEKDLDNIRYEGNWINERNDTISFIGDDETRLFVYKNFDPYYTTLYIYRIPALNSISLFPSHSSNLNDRKTYEAVLKDDEITIYGFNDAAKMTFKKID